MLHYTTTAIQIAEPVPEITYSSILYGKMVVVSGNTTYTLIYRSELLYHKLLMLASHVSTTMGRHSSLAD
jgi:hypothetical protein